MTSLIQRQQPPSEWIEIQKQIRTSIIEQDDTALIPLTHIGGVDISFIKHTNEALSAFVVMTWPELEIVHQIITEQLFGSKGALGLWKCPLPMAKVLHTFNDEEEPVLSDGGGGSSGGGGGGGGGSSSSSSEGFAGVSTSAENINL